MGSRKEYIVKCTLLVFIMLRSVVVVQQLTVNVQKRIQAIRALLEEDTDVLMVIDQHVHVLMAVLLHILLHVLMVPGQYVQEHALTDLMLYWTESRRLPCVLTPPPG